MSTPHHLADTLGKPMHRRSLVKALAGAGAAALAVRAIGPAVAHHTEQDYTVSANANFRSGPGTNYAIIGVIVKGAIFKINGSVQNNYAGVIYNGKTGWVLASLIVGAGGGTTTPSITGESVTTSAANLRSGPSTSNSILKVVAAGSLIGTSTTVQNGFRYVSHNGTGGWMYDAYTGFYGSGPVPGYQTTTANLNLREQPNTSAKILLVIPYGSKVVPTGALSNNYAEVTYNGVKGWAAAAYLK